MDVTEIIQEAYRDYDALARDPDYRHVDARSSFIRAEDVNAFASTLDLRFTNVINQVWA